MESQKVSPYTHLFRDPLPTMKYHIGYRPLTFLYYTIQHLNWLTVQVRIYPQPLGVMLNLRRQQQLKYRDLVVYVCFLQFEIGGQEGYGQLVCRCCVSEEGGGCMQHLYHLHFFYHDIGQIYFVIILLIVTCTKLLRSRRVHVTQLSLSKQAPGIEKGIDREVMQSNFLSI